MVKVIFKPHAYHCCRFETCQILGFFYEEKAIQIAYRKLLLLLLFLFQPGNKGAPEVFLHK
jgi:hypothetical protein